MTYPPDYGDMSVSYEDAEVISEVELATCRCPRDTNGQPHPSNVNDRCEWHGGIMERALASGKSWDPNDAWPWGESPAPRPAGGGSRV